MREKSYVMLKPGYEKFLKSICGRIEEKGGEISKVQKMKLSKKVVKEHYSHISHLDIFEDMVEYMSGGIVIGMVVEGEDIISKIRGILGSTKNPEKGTIRGDFMFEGVDAFQNVIHASDSQQAANEEILRFYDNAQKNKIVYIKSPCCECGDEK